MSEQSVPAVVPEQPVQPAMTDKLTSRKFIMVLFGHLINLWMFFQGKITPKEAMDYVLYLTAVYVGGNVFDSAAGALSSGKLDMSAIIKMLTSLGIVNGNGVKPADTNGGGK